MRMFSIALIALASLTQAQAQAQAQEPIESKKPAGIICGYSIRGNYYEVPSGESLCSRSPPPYGGEYALLHCYPPLLEGTLVKRGDPRCGGRYEERQ
jgi:hypothetical protein